MASYIKSWNENFVAISLVILLFNVTANAALLQSRSLSLKEYHLVRCLTHISHRYFAPGRSLVISSPDIYRDVQQELISQIQRTTLWPVVVTVDGNISKTAKTDFIDRDGNYIILIPDGNIEIFKAEINGLAQDGTKFTRLWNSEARFVVAGANEFSMEQQIDIFDYLSTFRIYNCIILSQEHYGLDRKYNRQSKVNDVDTGLKLAVYTWFPYQSSESCTDVNDIVLLDSWVISALGHFTKNTDLFPEKISKSFNGCPMQAVLRDGTWEFTTQYNNYTDSNTSVDWEIVGLEFQLLMIVLKQINMTFVHVPTPDGFEIDKGQTNSLSNALFEKEAYIALGGVGNYFLRDSFLDSTNAHIMTSVRWYVPCPDKYPRWSSIFRILSVELWLVLIISIMIAAISTTLLARYSCTSEWQGYKTLTSSLTNIWSVIVGVSVSTMPRASSLRSFFLAWVCFSVAFSTVFQAFLTTFLIDSNYKTPIKNMDELSALGLKLAIYPEFNFLFENGDEKEISNVKINLINYEFYDQSLDWTIFYKNASIFMEDLMVETYYAEGELVGENSEPLLCKLEDGVVFNNGLSMIMFHGDPLMRRVNEIIDRVVVAGLYNYWISKIMHMYKLSSRKIALVPRLDGYYSFNIYHMQPAFYLLMMGWCLSAICFMIELMYNRLLSKRK